MKLDTGSRQAAFDYADKGWAVLPLLPNKKIRTLIYAVGLIYQLRQIINLSTFGLIMTKT